MIKDIVVHLSLTKERDPTTHYAISLAELFEAHLTGVAVVHDPIVSPGVVDGVSTAWIDAQRSENRALADAAFARLDEAARRAGVATSDQFVEAAFGGASDLFARIGRLFDLVVVGQRDPDRIAPDGIPEAALFGSGRPVVVVPYIQRDRASLDRVLVCWDASRTAARAVGDALPFLARARKVDIVMVAAHGAARDEIPGIDLAHHLARHGITVELKRIVADDIDVSSAILSYAADVSADLVVMGGYGHSRLREFVLGGATRGLLASMTVPVLMSH